MTRRTRLQLDRGLAVGSTCHIARRIAVIHGIAAVLQIRIANVGVLVERAFLDVGRDRDNEIIIITGTGNEYCGPAVQPSGAGGRKTRYP